MRKVFQILSPLVNAFLVNSRYGTTILWIEQEVVQGRRWWMFTWTFSNKLIKCGSNLKWCANHSLLNTYRLLLGYYTNCTSWSGSPVILPPSRTAKYLTFAAIDNNGLECNQKTMCAFILDWSVLSSSVIISFHSIIYLRSNGSAETFAEIVG